MAPIELYYFVPSAPCRAVYLLARYLDLSIKLNHINVITRETREPKFLKINPTRTVPTIVEEDGFRLGESRAIMEYLAEKYGKNKLEPNDLKVKAKIRKILYFEGIDIYPLVFEFILSVRLIADHQEFDEEKRNKLEEKLSLLENSYEGPYFAGDELSIADFSVFATLTTLEVTDFDMEKYGKISLWIRRLKNELPFCKEINERGIDAYRQMLAKFAEKSK